MIRNYQPADLEETVKLVELNVPEYFAPPEIADFRKYLQEEREDYFIYESNGDILACGGINYEPDQAVISWDAVHPDHHGKGIGKELLLYRLDHIRKKEKHESVIVRTSQLTTGFYQKNGFLLKEIIENYWATGYHLYYMTLRLRS